MSGKQEGVKETLQQKALAEVAMKQMADYRKRWAPLQRQLAEQITSAGAPDSRERRKAAGKASTDSAVQFDGAQGQVTDTLASRTGLGSSRTKLAIASGGDDQATSRALGLAGTDQAIDDAYMQGLSALTAIGRGERAGAVQGLSQIADISGRQARADAETSLGRRMGNAQLVGQVAGFGLAGGFQSQAPAMQNIPADAGDFGGLSGLPGSR
jgi:hypothetical protein